MQVKKKLFLIDAYALIFRGYYAFIKNPRINSKGMDTSAIMGFMNSLLDLIKRESPENLAVAFDKGGSSDRLEIFEEYKANRNETPDAIKIAVPYIQAILKAMQIPILVKSGYEADDIIGTVAKNAEQNNYEVFMVTPDKDFAQLVSENIFMYRPARMGNGIEIWGVDEVQKKFEITDPLQVIDFLGMMGDSVDNIPGLPGVGEKTAKKFLAEYGSMEKLLENTDKIKGKLREKIELNKDKGLLSKKLATIMLDVPIDYNLENFKFQDPDINKIKEIAELADEDRLGRLIRDNKLRVFGEKNTSIFWEMVKGDSSVVLGSAGETDEAVTVDVKRVIRWIGSLHGKCGLRVTEMPLERLNPDSSNSFNPLEEAIVFSSDKKFNIIYRNVFFFSLFSFYNSVTM